MCWLRHPLSCLVGILMRAVCWCVSYDVLGGLLGYLWIDSLTSLYETESDPSIGYLEGKANEINDITYVKMSIMR